MSNNSFKTWMAQIRAPFLILAVFLVVIGLAFSVKYPQESGITMNWLHAAMLIIGVVLSHVSVNLFNEYSDFKTRIDFNTNRTPFSGGSGMMQAGNTRPENVKTVGIITLLLAGVIGIYFAIISHWMVLVFSIIGAFSVLFYTNFLAKYLLGELFAGLALGTLVVLGTYLAMTGMPGLPVGALFPREVLWISIPPGILTSLLLFLNEFPDHEADKEGGRKHLVIRFGLKGASYIYTAGMFATFGIIVLVPILGKMVPALGSNVMTVLLTDLLLAVSVFIDVL
jgi:1,4-dihydroxy-2-naphthoate polyprenyltransferase